MPILSLYLSKDGGARAWNVGRAAVYGAAIGILAALFKTFGPFFGLWHAAGGAAAKLLEIGTAAAAFALLCAGAAALRNLIARRLIWRK